MQAGNGGLMFEELFYIHHNTVKNVPLKFKRYFYELIDWDVNHLCLTGARGVGKTTLLLQHYHEKYGDIEKCLYISADNVEVSAVGLFKTASEYFKTGGEALIIDEIHKYPNWPVELKNIIDTFKGKKIMVSGSSSLNLQKGKADLSRRLVYHELKGLSFREYLELKNGLCFPPLPLKEILNSHLKYARRISNNLAVLKEFKQYLVSGYYPFFIEGTNVYLQKVLSIIEKVLYEDVAPIANIKSSNLNALKKILWIVATSAPFRTNIEKLSRELGISKEYVYYYIDSLEKAGLITGMRPKGRGFKLTRKPARLFIENTNLLSAIAGSLGAESERGTVRETFFVNQLKDNVRIDLSERGDFTVDSKYVLEIGGRGKGFGQITREHNSYVAADGLEIGAGNKIPLYLFGFLY